MQSIGWNVDSITLNIILPVGISFYTFQTLSYTIDVYRNQLKPTNNMVAFFSFISFFPQLVAGPIERASNLLPQMEKSRQYNYALLKAGIFQVFVGLFRKIVIADNLAIYVDSIYNNYGIHNSTTLILATIFYAFQIYFDFSGYSDIAIGTAKLFGFNFNRNFNLPYFSKSITEFWRRWHMSLSFWLRDYLYISLGGNRKGIRITYRNLLLTMILGGLWHGSSWNFIIWGLIHGVALSLEKYIFSKTKLKSFNYLYTFSIVTLAWVFFRTPDLHSAIEFFEIIFKIDFSMPFIGDINSFTVSITMLLIAILFDMWLFNKKVPLEEIGNEFNFRTLVLTTTTIIILLCLFYSTSENFIYFQF
jgi:D-alanyl-lipoteichoic acid acyltransferase DltB (MBOAT superfamily)